MPEDDADWRALTSASAHLQRARELLAAGPDLRGPTRLGRTGPALRRGVRRLVKFQHDHDVRVLDEALGGIEAAVDAVRAASDDRSRTIARLEAAVADLQAELADTHSRLLQLSVLGEALGRTQYGEGDQATIARGQAQIAAMMADLAPREQPGSRLPALSRVVAEVGELVLPAHDSYVLRALEAYGTWEPEEMAWLRERAHPGMVTLNVGAHVGHHALLLAREVAPTGFVIAVEPEPTNFACLCANLARNGVVNVVPIQAAAAEQSGLVELTRSMGNTGDHRAYRRSGEDVADIIRIDAFAIDDLLPAQLALDLVAIDVQGTDHRVVKGLEATLRKSRPPMLIEFWPPGIRDAGDDPEDVLSYYRSLGYDITILDMPDQPPNLAATDVIAMAEANQGNYVSLILEPV